MSEIVDQSGNNANVLGESQEDNGVRGVSHGTDGVAGLSDAQGHSGVIGKNDSQGSNGVAGLSAEGRGVMGISVNGVGVFGRSTGGPGVVGESETDDGVRGTSGGADGVAGISNAQGHSGVVGRNDTEGSNGVAGMSADGTGVFGKGGAFAGFFEGDVMVTGNITAQGDLFLANADCAEDFDIAEPEPIEPGTVMVIDAGGALRRSHQAYDKRVAGVISGAGDYRPGIVLGKQQSREKRMPIALMGKVYCKVDAQYAPIDVGDLLTTSPTSGHAMKVGESSQAFGAVIGKALRPLTAGQGLIPILIALQ